MWTDYTALSEWWTCLHEYRDAQGLAPSCPTAAIADGRIGTFRRSFLQEMGMFRLKRVLGYAAVSLSDRAFDLVHMYGGKLVFE